MRAIAILMGLGAMVAPALAQDDVVLDYRDSSVLDMADIAQWEPVGERIGGDVVVLGEVSGAFTEAGAEEIAYLVSTEVPSQIDPFPDVAQRLVIFAGDAQIADWALPEDSAYSRAVTARDLDGDGIDEVILEMGFYNMGTQTIGLAVVSVGETPEVTQTLPDVYIDSCEAGAGQLSIEASVVFVSDGMLSSQTETLPCA
ncbi:hypothetical protein SAMN05216456_0876 [Devosia crocina]|uniref:Repeat domain-containing protein n=1 Tax=Devosia crocina TaxID=429728 RepID=A0A1I7N5L2_9HYPH|nr:hypothetical protein [Devosia crocina]SFV29938.1 hypothetical protein SAMN05216456_0876 [Devosia crocina]